MLYKCGRNSRTIFEGSIVVIAWNDYGISRKTWEYAVESRDLNPVALKLTATRGTPAIDVTI
jgi:hypothetical protein